MFVKFYATWCGTSLTRGCCYTPGHCKKLAPEFSKAAKLLEGSGIVLAEVSGGDGNARSNYCDIFHSS